MSDETNPAEDEDLALRASIDRSLRIPLLFFFTSAAAWLFVTAILGIFSSLKLYTPGLFDNCPIFDYGRIYPAHINSLVYGWAMQAGFGVSLWVMARLCRQPLKGFGIILVAGHIWNLAISIGVIGILAGWGQSLVWLDFPGFVWPIMLIAYIGIVIWMLGLFVTRRDKDAYVSQWYLLASLFWFPWVFITTNAFVHHLDVAAVTKTVISGWYVSNMIFMVFGPIALAAAYYIVPKVIGRPIFSYGLTQVAFWSLVILSGWTGLNRFMGGPFPAWMATVGSAATIFLLIPAAAVFYGIMKTCGGRPDWINYSPSLRFTVFGVFSFLILVIVGSIISIFPTGRYLQFTHAQAGFDLLGVYGFFSMCMFGAIYFIVPRITGCEWKYAGGIRFHFWFSAYGMATIVLFTIMGGIAQGSAANNWGGEWIDVAMRVKTYLGANILGWIMIAAANFQFVYHLALMCVRRGRASEEGPTLIHKQPEDYFKAQQVAAGENA